MRSLEKRKLVRTLYQKALGRKTLSHRSEVLREALEFETRYGETTMYYDLLVKTKKIATLHAIPEIQVGLTFVSLNFFCNNSLIIGVRGRNGD